MTATARAVARRRAGRCAAPRDSASIASAPEPANRSSTRAPSSGPRIENSASRTRSDVGRVPRPGGAEQPPPAEAPRDDAHALTRGHRGHAAASAAASARSSGVAQQRVLGRLEARVLGEQRLGAGVRALEQLGVLGQPREAEAGQAGLARADELALAAQLEVDLGQLEAVAVARASARSRGESLGPNSRQSEACSPRPTRPRSWCSWEIP